ncbi:hypothetical protein RJ640_024798 [Escallonia rubra]|uniref:hAT-like transposase RNase-H fold domain-containing protein n=1 Tax=Escallonia rubra TaxID=112253 RepID=A0AA88R668_9ASTE|nr:hypothetical protein RJ640_024798 [Escallonia rubra]
MVKVLCVSRSKWRRAIGLFAAAAAAGSDSNMSCNAETRQALAKFFGYEESRTRTAEDQRVKEVLEMLSPEFPFSLDFFGRKCLKLFEEEKVKMKQILRNLDGKVSVSVDILRSGKHHKSPSEYLCLTAHFIDGSWNLKRQILNFSVVGPKGEGSPQEIIIKTLEEWDIKSKISTITMANKDLYHETVETVKDQIWGTKELQLNGRLFHVYCCADIINHMVQDAYQRVSDIVDQIGNVYSFKGVLPTWKNRSQQLKEAQIMYRHHPMFSGRRNRALYNTPSKKGWEKVSSICDLVDDIYGIVYPLFEMGFPTANIYFHHLEKLQTYLMQKSKNPNAFIRGVAEKMLQSFIKYMKDMHLVLAVASVLDPRFKMKYIEFSSSKFEGSDGDLQVSMVLDAVSKLYADYVKKFPVTEESASDSAPELEESKKYTRFFKAGRCSADEGSLGWELLQEYQQYIQSAEYQAVVMHETIEPVSNGLLFWNPKKNKA